MRILMPSLFQGKVLHSDGGRRRRRRGVEADLSHREPTAPQEPTSFLIYDREKQSEGARAAASAESRKHPSREEAVQHEGQRCRVTRHIWGALTVRSPPNPPRAQSSTRRA